VADVTWVKLEAFQKEFKMFKLEDELIVKRGVGDEMS
jgi:hypothetical protein